ncbi:MAG: Nif3-like dinuclear metal center hexameric protein [Prevotellaceae bacterium]|nr:Nif3-like dinuclear metal center hexameric protein [Prevotellaceae bacterium]MDY6130420.1 Nif3-like dinuclear metal center hexameric protein [Prevotella sp.]
MRIKEVVNALERFAPLPLQEGFDNAGLQIGLTETLEVSGVLLCLDITEKVVDEAMATGCNLIVSHHPLIFHPLKRISDENDVQRIVYKAIKHDIAIVSMHTNMDNAKGGVNFKIAEKMGLRNIKFFGEKKIIGKGACPSEPPSKPKEQPEQLVGASGAIGIFDEPMAADDFVLMLKRTFDVECVQANQLLHRGIERVAVCGGAGAFMLPEAIKVGADAFVTGEMHYHDYFDHEQEIQIAVIGHYQSEQYTNEIFKEIIEKECEGVKCCLTKTNTNPIIYL